MENLRNLEEDNLVRGIKYYQRCLHTYTERKDEIKVLYSLNRLSQYRIKGNHLKETGVRFSVNLLAKMDGKVGRVAKSLIEKWKGIEENETDRKSGAKAPQEYPDIKNQPRYEENSEETYSKYKKTLSDRKSSSRVVKIPRKNRKYDKKEASRQNENEINDEYRISVEDALEMLDNMPMEVKRPVKRDRSALYNSEFGSSSGSSEASFGMMEIPKKKGKVSSKQAKRNPSPVEVEYPTLHLPSGPLENIDMNISSLLPSISTNLDTKQPSNDLDTLNAFMTSKHERTQIYSGNKSSFVKGPSSFDVCMQQLQVEHIDDIKGTGGVPYSILKPVLEKATPNQLLRLEYYNCYLTEDSDELWQLHCQKDFRREKRADLETWRDMYSRCTEEREARLQTLTASIKLSIKESVPVMQTKIAYIDPPSRVKAPTEVTHTSVAPMAKAKIESMVRNSKTSCDVVLPHRVRAARGHSAAGSSQSQAKIKRKVAPLMAKTMSSYKKLFGR